MCARRFLGKGLGVLLRLPQQALRVLLRRPEQAERLGLRLPTQRLLARWTVACVSFWGDQNTDFWILYVQKKERTKIDNVISENVASTCLIESVFNRAFLC